MLWSFFFTWAFELSSCFVICGGWLKTRGLLAMCDMRRLFASEMKLQIAGMIVRKKLIQIPPVNILFLKKNWKFGHLLITSIEDWKLKLYSVHIIWRPQTANIVRWFEIEFPRWLQPKVNTRPAGQLWTL